MSFLSQYTLVFEAFATGISALVALLLLTVARRQTEIAQTQAKAQRLEAFREIVRHHHDPAIRDLRRIARVDLVNWFQSGKKPDESDKEWIKLKTAYEDVMNYYEYLGSLMKYGLVEEELIVMMVHNSAVAIWDQVHLAYGNDIRKSGTRAKDYAEDFKFLVEKSKSYRKRMKLDR